MTKFEPGIHVRTTRAWAKREGRPVITGRYLYKEGGRVTFVDGGGSHWRLYADDVEPWFPNKVVYLGDLEGWEVNAHTDGLASLVHRCGYEIDANDALPGLVLTASQHVCS